MTKTIDEIQISTCKRLEVVDITEMVEQIVKKSAIQEGSCLVYTGHATGAIIISENYDPNIGEDIQNCLQALIPAGKWLHDRIDNNGDSHIKASIIGPGKTIPLSNGRLCLGQWQNICFCEFDGPRKRNIHVKVMRYAV
ncbi:MAG: secondary thiamine-phosphate synthase enzyme YjbQ [Candidatus Woesearchaeota archaeon]